MKLTEERYAQMRAVSEKHNPTVNAISRLAYGIAGSARKYYALSKDARHEIRKTAKSMFSLGVDFSSAERAEKVDKRGFVYVITHPAWSMYVKVGRAFNPRSRLAGYQTGCPYRGYELAYAVYFEDCHFAEKEIHARLDAARGEGEWFRVSPEVAAWHINELREII